MLPRTFRAEATGRPRRPHGMINLDFDEEGRLVGIEVPAADAKLPAYLLRSAERLDADEA
ncbi:DUF2283 domain-containing protein [Streptomyces tritici]|uniref:DUF2283 domain-containing protein n=1 Tax=Streptomyces tritici TaxID=2054410 RepID=UPI003AF01856